MEIHLILQSENFSLNCGVYFIHINSLSFHDWISILGFDIFWCMCV